MSSSKIIRQHYQQRRRYNSDKTLLPDIVFLDIEMPKCNGFQLLEKVHDIYFHLIFTTAYDNYALKAFKFSALDYLLKPIMADELKGAINKLLQGNKYYQEKIQVREQSIQATKTRCNAHF